MRRTEPLRCQGLQIWSSLMRYSMFFAIVVNTGLAAFVVETPVSKRWSRKTHFLFFIMLEHVMLFGVSIFAVMCNDVPKEALRRQEQNLDWEPTMMDPRKNRSQITLKKAPEYKL